VFGAATTPWRSGAGGARVAAAAAAAAVLLVALWFFGPPPAAASAPSSCPGRGQAVCVDRADGGRTVHLRVGQRVQVVLSGATLQWSGPRLVGPHLLRLRGRATDGAGTLRASYVAVGAGRTTLEASGAPKCSPGKACPQFILLWQVRVVVR